MKKCLNRQRMQAIAWYEVRVPLFRNSAFYHVEGQWCGGRREADVIDAGRFEYFLVFGHGAFLASQDQIHQDVHVRDQWWHLLVVLDDWFRHEDPRARSAGSYARGQHLRAILSIPVVQHPSEQVCIRRRYCGSSITRDDLASAGQFPSTQ